MKQDLVTVLDIGSTKLIALVVTTGPKGLKVKAQAVGESKGVRKGTVLDANDLGRSIELVFKRLRHDFLLENSSVVVGISGSHLLGQTNPGYRPIVPRSRHITNQDVMEVINHSRSLMLPPDREQVQAVPREFRVDDEKGIMVPIGKTGGKLEVTTYIVSGSSPQIQLIEKAVAQSGLAMGQLVLQPLAAGMAVLSANELQHGTMVVDLGGGKTDYAIFVDGSIGDSGCVPIGSLNVTSDISQLLKTNLEEAERVKIQSGTAWIASVTKHDSVAILQVDQPNPRPLQRQVLAEIIESRIREIAEQIKVKATEGGLLGAVGTMVLTGGGSGMQGVAEVFRDEFAGISIRTSEPDTPGLPKVAGCAVAVGLAQFAFQCMDELSPATDDGSWKSRMKGWLGMGSK